MVMLEFVEKTYYKTKINSCSFSRSKIFRIWKQNIQMATNKSIIESVFIDGSYLEGGGQILRIVTGLSVLLKKPINIKSIRAGRKDGGFEILSHIYIWQIFAKKRF